MAIQLKVCSEEAGQKLFSFLQRCLNNENSEMHRWIRTGQVRINSARAKAFDRVNEGDIVRIPPFAEQKDATLFADDEKSEKSPTTLQYMQNEHTKIIEKVYEDEHILVVNKPYNLPCQGGTGQQVHLVQILKDAYQHARFVPAPAHRLDKHSTGIVLIGKSYKGLRFLSDFMQEENKPFTDDFLQNKSHKEYLAWVHGNFENIYGHEAFYMVHYLYHDEEQKRMQALSLKEAYEIDSCPILEKINAELTPFTRKASKNNAQPMQCAIPFSTQNAQLISSLPSRIQFKNKENTHAQIALSLIKCLKVQGNHSLLNISIFTGRKHQIRVQCAHLGFTLVGDEKYGNKSEDTLKLHAYRICLPKLESGSLEARELKVLPNWDEKFSVDGLSIFS